MPIDPTIALGIKPPQIESPFAVYMRQAQMQEAQNRNALARYQFQKLQEEEEARNALGAAYKNAVNPDGSIDEGKLISSMAQGRAASQIPAVQKTLLEGREKQAKIKKEQIDAALQDVKLHRDALVSVNDPQSYAAWRASVVKAAPFMDATVPQQFSPQAKAALLMNADQMVERLYAKLVESDEGGTKAFRNPYTGDQVGPSIQKTQTPDSIASNETTRRGQNMVDARAREQIGQDRLSQPFEAMVNGQNVLVQQDKKSGQLVDVNTKQPVGGVAPKMSAEAQGAMRDVEKLKSTLDKMIGSYKPEYVGARGAVGEVSDQYLSQAPLVGGAFGDKDRVQFRQLASTVVNDYIKAITGATVGQSGEQQRLMRAVPSPNDSDIVFRAKMDEMRRNLDELPNIIAGGKAKSGGSGWGPLERVK